MTTLRQRLEAIDFSALGDSLHQRGFATEPGLLTRPDCEALVSGFAEARGFRKQVLMERYRYGRGVYKYWDYPLPAVVQELRDALYPRLAPLANRWMEQLGMERRYPDNLAALLRTCSDSGQRKPTPLILKYGAGGFNTLHQDIYGEVFFPLQAAVFLNEPGVDYTGGEFVITEQAARAQARATVLSPGRGDLLVFATRWRPVPGARGYTRAAVKHGVAEVRSGWRYTAGVIFHDAIS